MLTSALKKEWPQEYIAYLERKLVFEEDEEDPEYSESEPVDRRTESPARAELVESDHGEED